VGWSKILYALYLTRISECAGAQGTRSATNVQARRVGIIFLKRRGDVRGPALSGIVSPGDYTKSLMDCRQR